MNLYSLTLEPSSSITISVAGNFYGPKSHDLVTVNGSERITVFTQNPTTSMLEAVQTIKAFSQIRQAVAYRPLGFAQDLLLLTSDSGMMTLVELSSDEKKANEGLKMPTAAPRERSYKVVCQETLSRTGCRRIAVGAYVAKDPKGRALILGAIEKNKLIYLTSKGSGEGAVTLSSPLEANIPHAITFDMVGLDVGYDNPLFCAIEANYGDIEDKASSVYTGELKKSLVFYEIDLGLNQVIRKKSVPLSLSAHALLSVPQTEQFSGGVAVISKEKLELYSAKAERLSEVSFPRRIDDYKSKHSYQVTSFCMYRLKNYYFYLLQNQLGDIFKVKVDEGSSRLALDYLCTDKIATSMTMLKTGFLFKANENSDHEFFSIVKLDPSSATTMTEGFYVPLLIAGSQLAKSESYAISFTITEFNKEGEGLGYFTGFESLQTFQSLSGQVDAKFADLVGDGVGQHYTITSGVNGSVLRSMRFTVEIEELAKSSLPIKPRALFPVNKLYEAGQQSSSLKENTDFLLLSVPGKTHVLRVKDKIEDVTEDIGFSTASETLHLMDLYNGQSQLKAWVQVTQDEIRIVSANSQHTRTRLEGGQRIRLAASHNEKLLLFSSTFQLHLYYQIADNNSVTIEHQSRAELEMEVVCMTVFGGAHRTSALMAALGFADSTVRVYSLDPRTSLTRLSLLTLSSVPESIVFSQGHLVIGSASGSVSRAQVDQLTGALGEVRIRNLSELPVKIFQEVCLKSSEVSSKSLEGQGADKMISEAQAEASSKDRNGLLFCGSKVFYGQEADGVFDLRMVNIHEESRITSLCKLTGQFGDKCFVFLTENGLMKIVKIKNEGAGSIVDKKLPLSFSGRKILINQENLSLIVVESQCRVYSADNLSKKISKMKQHFAQSSADVLEKLEGLPEVVTKQLKFAPKQKHWESKITILTPGSFKRIFTLDFPGNNKHILTASLTSFKDFDNESFLLASVCEDHDILANKFASSWIATYCVEDFGKRLVLLHNTKLDFLSFALWGFRGRVLVGAGSYLRLYELGKKQLLKKNELKRRFNLINGIKTVNQRIFVSDAADSVHLIKYDENENQFQEVADDILPRYITAFEVLDFNTLAAADKFGNFFVLRLPHNAEEELTEDFATYKLRWENSYLNAAPVKFEQVCAFYDINSITFIQKAVNPRTNYEYIIVGNVEGKVAAYLPFETKSEVDFFKHLELLLRSEEGGFQFITDRNHLLFRGYYSAVKGVVDGDLCEEVLRLKESKRRFIVESLERTSTEVAKRFEDLRFKLA